MQHLAQSFNRRRHQVTTIFSKFDKNLDGNLDVQNFERALSMCAGYTDPQMGGAFYFLCYHMTEYLTNIMILLNDYSFD